MKRSYRSSHIPFLGLMLLSLFYLLVVIVHRNFVPYWDGDIYYHCIAQAAAGSFSLVNFRCFDHPSVVYALYLGLTQYADQGNVTLMYVANAALAIASFVAFYYLLLRLFHPILSTGECILLVWLYAAMPVLVAHLFHINLDFGLVCFFIIYLSFLVHHRLWWASLFAVALLFTKETGAAAYVISAILYVALLFPKSNKRMRRKRLFILALPGLLLAAFYTYLAFSLTPDNVLWGNGSKQMSIGNLLSINPTDAMMRSLLGDIFVINFQWILSLVILTACCLFIAQMILHTRRRSWNTVRKKQALFHALLLIMMVFALTRAREYNNPRYVLLAYPVFIIAYAYSLAYLFRKQRPRLLCLWTCLALIFASNFRTIDSVSMAYYGTFEFGKHLILDMASARRSDTRLDETVYNLEFMRYDALMRALLADIKPTNQTVFLTGGIGAPLPTRVDAVSFAPTMHFQGTIALIIADRNMLEHKILTGSTIPSHAYYISFPNVNADNAVPIMAHFDVQNIVTYDQNGYALSVLSLVKKRAAIVHSGAQ